MSRKSFPTPLVWQASKVGNSSNEKYSVHEVQDLIEAVFPEKTNLGFSQTFTFVQTTLGPELERQFPGLGEASLDRVYEQFGARMEVSVAQNQPV